MSTEIKMPGDLKPIVEAYFVSERQSKDSGRLTITIRAKESQAIRARDFAEAMISTVRALRATAKAIAPDEYKEFDWAITEACVIDNVATFTVISCGKELFKPSKEASK